MNFPLFKQMIKVNAKGMMNYAFGSAFYILLIIWLYPGIAKNTQALNDIVKSMPEGVNNAFGLNSGFASAEAFISGEYYGLILVLILSIVCVQMSTRLMAGMVDQGSMAYLLSTPTTRAKVSTTQALVLIMSLIVIVGVTTLAGFLGEAWFLGDSYPFNGERFLQLNLVAFMLFFAIGGLTFLVSCLSNDEKKALGISGLIAFGFFTIDLVAKISDKLSWMKSLTLFTLYRPSEIVAGQAEWGRISLVLLAVGLLSFGLGIVLFKRRDLPL
ncbi:ABC transporter permease subunit [Paenibacillus sp. URB8-2]|uniref:ABC transporter permease subunit n=1 Tax=Paenibacillus sp. URB8-2 TaxID=2741301 RepID=UPI0015BD8D2D|nr:ABC transporter permease subunit [Paenibacillus sp. URB8-2]BCG58213.1 ABC transporter permease [Paenibacillus sp. URB8-2]